MIKLLLIFLVIYVAFIAVAINYARAFRTKNFIVDSIEKFEGYNKYVEEEVDAYLVRITYNVPREGPYGNYAQKTGATCHERGYCVEETSDGGVSNYKVTTFISIDLFGLGISFPISSEVRISHL